MGSIKGTANFEVNITLYLSLMYVRDQFVVISHGWRYTC